jgi:hypothetical protein
MGKKMSVWKETIFICPPAHEKSNYLSIRAASTLLKGRIPTPETAIRKTDMGPAHTGDRFLYNCQGAPDWKRGCSAFFHLACHLMTTILMIYLCLDYHADHSQKGNEEKTYLTVLLESGIMYRINSLICCYHMKKGDSKCL